MLRRGIPIYIDHSQVPTFHPVRQRDDTAWHPGNEAASLMIHIRHVWDDILMLRDIMVSREGEDEKRLLFKYILVELHSLLEPIEQLQSIIMKAPERNNKQSVSEHSVTTEEKQRVKALFKAYHVARNRVDSELSDIRNSIGAHRRHRSWDEVTWLWDSLEPSEFVELLNTIPPIYNFVKSLDLYEWIRATEDGGIQTIVSKLHPEDFEE